MPRIIELDQTTPVLVPMGGRALSGDLGMPAGARGIVVFAHGSGSSRHSPRNRHVARALERRALATLLIDPDWTHHRRRRCEAGSR